MSSADSQDQKAQSQPQLLEQKAQPQQQQQQQQKRCKYPKCEFFATADTGYCTGCHSRFVLKKEIAPKEQWEVGVLGKQPRRAPIPNPPEQGPKCGPFSMPAASKELGWRLELKQGDLLDAFDGELWYSAKVLEVRYKKDVKWLFVTYLEWNGDQYDEWFHWLSPYIAPHKTRSRPRIDYQYERVRSTPDASCIFNKPVPPLVTEHTLCHMIVRRVPSDNNCLFHAISHVCDGVLPEKMNLQTAKQQRLRAFETVRDRKEEFGAYLDVPMDHFRLRVLSTDVWGEDIDLHALSLFYRCEIFTFDITALAVYKYGIGKGYKYRVFLIYWGRHYDCIELVYYDALGNERVQEFFSAADDKAVEMARECAEEEYRTLNQLRSSSPLPWTEPGLGAAVPSVPSAPAASPATPAKQETKRVTAGSSSSDNSSSNSSGGKAAPRQEEAKGLAARAVDAAACERGAREEQGRWQCGVCEFTNSGCASACFMCEAPRALRVVPALPPLAST